MKDQTNKDQTDEKNISINYDEQIEGQLDNISESLANQIQDELRDGKEMTEKPNKKTLKKVLKGATITVTSLLLMTMFLILTPPGHKILKVIGGKIWTMSTNDFEDGFYGPEQEGNEFGEGEQGGVIGDDDLEELKPGEAIFINNDGEGRHEDYTHNILILGEDGKKSKGYRGQTDVMMIATINTKDKSVKLTSLMRDSYVQIPGYKDNRLNSAYPKGGVNLLYKTIAQNYDIRLDGCVLVDFESFPKIIESMGGVNVKLNATEASHINGQMRSKNLREGNNNLSGEQALAYSRIRKKSTSTGSRDDFGRTDRQRIVLDAIFQKYKDLGKLELLSTTTKMLPLITTDISGRDFEILISKFLETGARDIQELRLPMNGAYEAKSVRGMSVLVLDYDKNVKALHEFIFGD